MNAIYIVIKIHFAFMFIKDCKIWKVSEHVWYTQLFILCIQCWLLPEVMKTLLHFVVNIGKQIIYLRLRVFKILCNLHISDCSTGYETLSYPRMRSVNTQVVEQSNAKLRKLKSSLSYIRHENFKDMLQLFLWFSNHQLKEKMRHGRHEWMIIYIIHCHAIYVYKLVQVVHRYPKNAKSVSTFVGVHIALWSTIWGTRCPQVSKRWTVVWIEAVAALCLLSVKVAQHYCWVFSNASNTCTCNNRTQVLLLILKLWQYLNRQRFSHFCT